MSSKQTKINFGSNRNKPKQDLFHVCFGLFRETKNKKFNFVSVFRTYIETTETKELFRNKQKQTEATLNFLKNTQIYSLLSCLGGSLFVLVQSKHRNSLFRYRSETTETNCFETNRKKQKKTKKTKNKQKNRKTPKFSEKIS